MPQKKSRSLQQVSQKSKANILIVYARQSIEKENSISIETQIEYCKCIIRPEERDLPVKVYKDKGKSGGNTNRKDFQAMMSEVRKGRVKKVIVYKLDRISRSLSDFVNILQEFKNYGVEFVSANEAFDTSSPYGELVVKILMVFGEFERNSIIQRVTDAYATRSDMGLFMGGPPPYGFTLEPTVIANLNTKQLIPVPDELEQVIMIYDMYSQGVMSLGMLVKNLVANGEKPYHGKDWTNAKLSKILKNPIYVKADAAIYEYFQRHGTQIKNDISEFNGEHGARLYGWNKHDPSSDDWSDMKLVLLSHKGVIDSDIWLKCQSKLNHNNQIRRGAGNTTTWLGGKVYCALCGHMMAVKKYVANDRVYRYFVCSGRSSKKQCPKNKAAIYVDDIEAVVYEEVIVKLESLKGINADTENKSPAGLNECKLKIQEIEKQENNLIDMLVSGSINDATTAIVNRKADELKMEKTKIYERMDQIIDTTKALRHSVNFVKKWKRAGFNERKAVLSIVLDHITIDKEGNIIFQWNF